MNNRTQLERYKKLLAFLDENFKEAINIPKIEQVSYYSYRNINRIFEAIHNETIGKYIKRLRLEKAAQYLKYSDLGVSNIAYEVGFEDRAAFSKAFKNMYGSSPSNFRDRNETIRETMQQSLLLDEEPERRKLEFEIEFLPDFEYLFLEYRGAFQDFLAINKEWDKLVDYAATKALLSDQSIFMTEIVDDTEISNTVSFRYNLALVLEKPLNFELKGFFRTKKHNRQKYAKFTHKGSEESSFAYYKRIYAFWMLDVVKELVDLPTLEFYPNFSENIPKNELITEIYIPIA
ncbi:MAG: GyrI-like domain-containing protein [Flavobacteriaceae bacterium]